MQNAEGQGQGCWRLSSPSTINMCAAEGRICIEWGDSQETGPLGTACCDAGALPSGCVGTCAMLERQLVDGMTPAPTLPIATGALKALDDAAPIRPEHPVTYRGKVYGVDELAALDGKELHYLFVLDGGDGESVLYALDDRTKLGGILEELNRSEDPSLRAQLASGRLAGAALYDGAMWQGANYFLPAGSGVDFRDNWWSNKLTSIRGAGYPTWLTLFSGPGYSGSSLTVSTAWDRPNLGVFGWDGRVSSAYLWPRERKVQKPGASPFEATRSPF
ncbi:MAG: hypothetical protein AAGF23_10480 [Acidobacteriota bacterium]